MKFSYNWLNDLVDGLALDPTSLMRRITQKTAECEGVEPHAPWLRQVVLARVLEAHPIPGSKNVRAIVDAGALGRKQVVCGAPNCRAGLLTAYIPAGTPLANLTIGHATISGVESEGMLAAGDELGINRDHDSIVEFAAGEPGQPLPQLASDWIIEVDNKSLTHRPDLWGHHGMAREVAAIAGGSLKDPVDPLLLPAPGGPWSAEIENYGLAPRYSALVFENVTVGPSPLWLQARLEAIGLNSISNIVDVTNWIMAELAQPMHAFDADKLHGHTIYVRSAREGEACAALNGETYTLNPSNLVIADERGAVAIAGVIGGAGSAISSGTRRIVLESANFNAASVRKTSSALKLRTDASMRFEKAQDPVNTTRALARAVALLEMVSPGIRLTGGLVDNYRPPAAPSPIELPLAWLERKLGRTLDEGEPERILRSLEFKVSEARIGVLAVEVPSWRATKDITIKDDLLEEIGRMVGYDTIPPQPPLKPVERPWINETRLFHHRIREAVAAAGFTESYNYSFVNEEMAARFGFTPEQHVRVLNPISTDQSLLRISLLPAVHRNIVENARFSSNFRLFEIGHEIHKRAEGLPNEVPRLMAAIYGEDDGQPGFMELKRLAAVLAPQARFRPVEARGYEHPARAAQVELGEGTVLGRLYELHPAHLEKGRATILDLDLRALQQSAHPAAKYRPIPRFPSSAFDLSVVTGLRALAGDILELLTKSVPADSVEYLYSYRGAPLPDDRQSLTYRFTISATDHTLTNEELTARRESAIAALRQAGYEIRG